jgi:hypothetical protein
MTRHTTTRGRGNEGATGEWSGYPACLAWPQSIASLAQYKCHQLTRTPRLPVVDWTVTPVESHGHVRVAGRRNQVSARVPSNLNCTLHAQCIYNWIKKCVILCVICTERNTLNQFPVFLFHSFLSPFVSVLDSLSVCNQLYLQTNAHNKIQNIHKSQKTLRVSAPRCHPQEVTNTKEYKHAHTNLYSARSYKVAVYCQVLCIGACNPLFL